MRKLIEFLMKAYLKIVNFFRKIVYPNTTKKYFKVPDYEFNKLINQFPYKADPLNGLLDYVDTPDNFFNPDKKEGRDCDDFQRMWSLWGTYNGYQSKEFVICDPTSIKSAFSTMHVIGILKDLNKQRYFLTNYQFYGPFNTEEEALGYMKNWASYQKDSLIVFSREIPPDPNPN